MEPRETTAPSGRNVSILLPHRISMSINEARVRTSRNMSWTPRPGWVTVRLVGSCADPALRRGQVVLHSPIDEDPVGPSEELTAGTAVIVLSEAAHLVEDDLHLVPEMAIVAVGEILP